MIYKSRRIGQYGKIFTLYKFKTMRDGPGPSSTSNNDPRITRVGKFLRRSKLDELPQLINWLKGDIKLIGWRPEDPRYLNTFNETILATKPGLIGLATLWDIDEGAMLADSQDPDLDYEQKILPNKRALETFYAEHKNWKLDLWILKQTILTLLKLQD